MSDTSKHPVWQVVSARCLRPFVIEATFIDGFSREIDMADELQGVVFQPLKDPSYFLRGWFDAKAGTIVWPNGADLAPEFLRWGRCTRGSSQPCACEG